MAQKDWDALSAELRNFAGLWQSGTISCIAAMKEGSYINLATRIVLDPAEVQQQTVVRPVVDPTQFEPPFFATVVQAPIDDVTQALYQIVVRGCLPLMDTPVYLSRMAASSKGEAGPDSGWWPTGPRPRSTANKEWGIDRPLRVMVWSGQQIYEVLTPEQLNSINARLKGMKPTPIPGIAGLIRELMPGASTDLSNGLVQIAAPLPFDLSYQPRSGVSVVAPKRAFQNGMVVSVFYKPNRDPERHEPYILDTQETRERGLYSWQRELSWPNGAETATVDLLYNDVEIDALNVPRPPPATPSVPVQETARESTSNRSDWERVGEPIGEGGQSQVLLVRRPARVLERASAARDIRAIDPRNTPVGTSQFAEAIWRYARPDDSSELGAMKVFNKLREAGPEGERQALERLKAEIAVLRQNRSGLPVLLAANEEEKWIVTEFFPRGTLEKALDKYKGKPAPALRMLRSLVETVALLHDEKIVHRDIKPANVFIRQDDEVVLGDFGIVFLPNQPDRQTRTNERVGPRDYMPPWADRDKPLENVEPNFDVYMLGKLLWCMVAGRLKLFREEHHSPEFDLTVAFPNDLDMHIINSIIDRCVVLKPGDCLKSARELLPLLDENMGILDRGGHLLLDDVPRPCRVCGKGRYQAVSLPRNVVGESKVAFNMAGMPISVALFACDYCGNVQLFR